MSEANIVWQGRTVFVTHTASMADVAGPYAVCVSGATHAVIIGRTAHKDRAIRTAKRLDRYPANARRFAGL